MHWIEKANSMRELADSKEDNINILRILNVPNTELEKNIQMLIDYHHSAAMNTINALLASNAICAKQGEALLENLQKLNIKELSFFYLENMEKSASANNKMSENVDENNRSIRKLERCKNSYWYLCFACQSFGLILGLIAIIFKK